MDRRPCLSRRRALGALALGTSATAGLAACGPDDEGFGNADPVQASDDAVALSEIPENATTLVNFGGQEPYVAIVRGSGGDVTALSGYCTHQGCALAVGHDGAELDCPCHGSRFDASSGDVLRGPAADPLPEVTVEVDGDTLKRVR
ncbi:Rieske (2Fe-2S) protein [Brachybacterium sp. MASK1Z-5]|uniref:Cytochrome bc1 complex Rieske iron-sulfur subunit n=1 Tax=Brachybacterium halotolerans TaxID=2795215 RepID=A0ABS1BCH5_9MICO|nr:Rieske (2Fe-2S) protein [Brachybacterium halotolerans]MBK0332294.1 Rieske (2Fe-2S) protein [Brachybacterium halotolerans]